MFRFKTCFFLILISLSSLSLDAQTIDIEFGEASNREYSLSFYYGLKMDTVVSGNLDNTGCATIKLPESNKGYRGLASLKVSDFPLQVFIVNGENFKMKYENAILRFENSPENDAFLKKNTNLLSDTTLYANRFLDLSSYFQALRSVISGQNMGLGNRYRVRNYAEEKLNTDDLYTSGLWFFIIDGLTQLYSDQESFAKAMISILKRIKSETVYRELSENVITIMNQYGWEDAFDIVVPSIVESGRIEYPQGILFDAFQMAKLMKGSLAPDLEGLSVKSHNGQTLILFFEADCSNCRSELKKLIEIYDQLKAKGIRVISISADHDKKIYTETIKNIPWKDAFCDYKGFASPNFVNYGISATPTYFLLDSDQKIVKRFSQIGYLAF